MHNVVAATTSILPDESSAATAIAFKQDVVCFQVFVRYETSSKFGKK